jgi:hypothetical protein
VFRHVHAIGQLPAVAITCRFAFTVLGREIQNGRLARRRVTVGWRFWRGTINRRIALTAVRRVTTIATGGRAFIGWGKNHFSFQ